MATSQLPCPAPRSSPTSHSPTGPAHKTQQSHDSGTYLDWSPEDGPQGDFVTVVSVEGSARTPGVPVPQERTTPFVTVLSIGTEQDAGPAAALGPAVVHVEGRPRPLPEGAEEVCVYRLPGERLGFGLKFEGGSGLGGVALGGVAPGDAVRRLLIQSCAPESPASRATCTWGALGEGDEILEIDQVPVNTLTKAECVHAMKESKVVMRLVVRGGVAAAPGTARKAVVCGEIMKKASPPPPIPPRKSRPKSEPPSTDNIGPPTCFADQDGLGDEEKVRLFSSLP